MSQVKVSGNASGTGVFEIAAPNANTNYTLTLPQATTTLVGTDATQTLTNKTYSNPTFSGTTSGTVITSGTAQASTSGASITFTGIPSWVKRVTVMLNGVSTTGTSPYLIRLGYSGGVETTGYVSATQYISSSANVTRSTFYSNGFGLQWSTGAAGEVNTAVMQFTYLGSNIWLGMGVQNYSTASGGHYISGQKTMSGTLDRISVTTSGGADTFDLGSINILYE